MGLIADLEQLIDATGSYAQALDRAYAAAVQQLQVTADLEAKARSAALAMVNASQQTALAAAKMQQAVTAGVNGMGQQEAIRDLAMFNPSSYQNSKYIQSGDKQQAGLHYTEARFAGLTDALIDGNTAIKEAVDAFANYKLDTARNGRLETNINVLVDQLKKQGMSAQDIQTAVRPQYAELERLRGEYKIYLQQLKDATDAAIKASGAGAFGAHGAGGGAETYTDKDLIALMVDAFRKSPYGVSEEVARQVVAAQYALRAQGPSKTYQLDLTAGTQKLTALTDQDPEQFLAALTRMLADAQRSAL